MGGTFAVGGDTHYVVLLFLGVLSYECFKSNRKAELFF